MHSVLYVCLPRSQARNSLQARKKVCEYLTEEGFDNQRRFSGHCDYFSFGGRWSGRLPLLRLRSEQPKVFDRFWKQYGATSSSDEVDRLCRLFRETFPAYRGKMPIYREHVEFYGCPTACSTASRPRTATISTWTSRTKPTFSSASCCRSQPSDAGGSMSTTSAKAGGMRSCSRGSRLSNRR